MNESDLYGDAIEFFNNADDDLDYHLKTCGECREHGLCPLGKEELESYNFAVLAVRVWERDNNPEDTALPRLQ